MCVPEFNYTFKWVDDGAYGFKNKDSGEWNGLMGELLAQVGGNDPVLGKSRSNTLRPLHNTFSRPVGYPVYTNLGGAIETGILFLGRAGNNRC